MPIEFRCQQCDKLLRTPDATAGKHARCPSCGNIQPVPATDLEMPGTNAPASTHSPAPAPSEAGQSQPSASPPAANSASDPPAPSSAVPVSTATSAGQTYRPTTMDADAPTIAQRKVQAPAIALIVTAVLGFGFHGLLILAGLVGLAEGGPADETMPMILAGLFNLPLYAFIFFGGIQLRRLRSPAICMSAAVAAVLPCGCCFWLGIPFGIWALVTLSDPAVKGSFH